MTEHNSKYQFQTDITLLVYTLKLHKFDFMKFFKNYKISISRNWWNTQRGVVTASPYEEMTSQIHSISASWRFSALTLESEEKFFWKKSLVWGGIELGPPRWQSTTLTNRLCCKLNNLTKNTTFYYQMASFCKFLQTIAKWGKLVL